jgi:hypothetical protein
MIGDVTVKVVDKARNLGIIFDKKLNMEAQVKNICKTGYFHIKNIAHMRNSLDVECTKTLVNAFVTSALDNGNSLLYNISKGQINKLQILQNSSARLIKRLRKYDHITETLKELHWLPVTARIEFKILTLTWKALHNMAPDYLKDLLNFKVSNRPVRAKYVNLLIVPNRPVNANSYNDRAFENAAPKLWNKLPVEIRNTETLGSFKKLLKTHLFHMNYN